MTSFGDRRTRRQRTNRLLRRVQDRRCQSDISIQGVARRRDLRRTLVLSIKREVRENHGKGVDRKAPLRLRAILRG
jgi:hypothetical protein